MRRTLVVVGVTFVVLFVCSVLIAIGQREEEGPRFLAGSNCLEKKYVIMEAQSVQGAQLIPCLGDALDGWDRANENYSNDGSEIGMTTGETNGATLTIALHATCTPDASATPRKDESPDYDVVETTTTNPDNSVQYKEWYTFAGGCAVSDLTIPHRFDEQRIFDELDASFYLLPRSAVNDQVLHETDGQLTLDPS